MAAPVKKDKNQHIQVVVRCRSDSQPEYSLLILIIYLYNLIVMAIRDGPNIRL